MYEAGGASGRVTIMVRIRDLASSDTEDHLGIVPQLLKRTIMSFSLEMEKSKCVLLSLSRRSPDSHFLSPCPPSPPPQNSDRIPTAWISVASHRYL